MSNQQKNSQEIIFDKTIFFKSLFKDVKSEKEAISKMLDLTTLLRPTQISNLKKKENKQIWN